MEKNLGRIQAQSGASSIITYTIINHQLFIYHRVVWGGDKLNTIWDDVTIVLHSGLWSGLKCAYEARYKARSLESRLGDLSRSCPSIALSHFASALNCLNIINGKNTKNKSLKKKNNNLQMPYTCSSQFQSLHI